MSFFPHAHILLNKRVDQCIKEYYNGNINNILKCQYEITSEITHKFKKYERESKTKNMNENPKYKNIKESKTKNINRVGNDEFETNFKLLIKSIKNYDMNEVEKNMRMVLSLIKIGRKNWTNKLYQIQISIRSESNKKKKFNKLMSILLTCIEANNLFEIFLMSYQKIEHNQLFCKFVIFMMTWALKNTNKDICTNIIDNFFIYDIFKLFHQHIYVEIKKKHMDPLNLLIQIFKYDDSFIFLFLNDKMLEKLLNEKFNKNLIKDLINLIGKFVYKNDCNYLIKQKGCYTFVKDLKYHCKKKREKFDCCANLQCQKLLTEWRKISNKKKFKICGKCKKVKYCSRRCQKCHWKESHKWTCTKFI